MLLVLRNPTLLLAGAAACLTATGCRSKITGNEGNFEFSYFTDDDFTDFNKPIAVGARLDLLVNEVGGGPVGLTAASTEDEGVLDVVSFGADTVILEGLTEGNTLIEVTGLTRDGEKLEDSINMGTAIPEVHDMWHTCTANNTARYLTGSSFVVPFELEMNNGLAVIGYGYYPVSFSSSQLDLGGLADRQAYMTIDAGLVAGTYTIDSDIDLTSLSVVLVDAEDIDGAELASATDEVGVGNTEWHYVRPTVAGSPICQAFTNKTVESTTTSICTVSNYDGDRDQLGYSEWGWFQVTGVAAGDCLITVDFTDGLGGLGAEVDLDFTIVP